MLPKFCDKYPHLDLVEKYCAQYGLDKREILSLIFTESDGNNLARREEPVYRYFYELDKMSKLCSVSISEMKSFQATSWGCCQIMGAVFFEMNKSDKLAEPTLPTELFNASKSIDLACRIWRKIIKDHYSMSPNWTYAAYNAGSPKIINGKFSNQKHVDRYMSFYNQFVAEASPSVAKPNKILQ